ncbi:MAG: hypothetical protein WCT12_21295 [Verrucomicrobiota bacterium]
MLPWVYSRSLVSQILSGVIQPLLADWSQRHGYQPVLLETFVETPRKVGGYFGLCSGRDSFHIAPHDERNRTPTGFAGHPEAQERQGSRGFRPRRPLAVCGDGPHLGV